MKLKNKLIYYIIGLAIATVTFFPAIPNALKYLISLVPILFFGADLTLQYMQEFYKKNFINIHLTAIIASLGLIVTGKPAYAAITMILFSAADHFFNKALDRQTRNLEEASRIIAPYAKTYIKGKISRISIGSVTPGQALVLEKGDIVPCDCTVINGEAELDYTNIFGIGKLRDAKAGSTCFSGGIIRSGKLSVKALKAAKDSLAASVGYRTKKAQALSGSQKNTSAYAKLFERIFYLLSIIIFITLLIITKDFALAVNQASVILVASSAIGFAGTLPILNLNALLSGRRRGVIFTGIKALEQSGKLRTVSTNEPVSKDVLDKIEETGAVPARGGYTKEDAVIYSDKVKLESDPNPSFKLALGFFSSKAQAAALDTNPEHIAGAILTGQRHRAAFRQNLILFAVGKLTVIALAFLFNIIPAIAIAVEFIVWMICLFNATKEI